MPSRFFCSFSSSVFPDSLMFSHSFAVLVSSAKMTGRSPCRKLWQDKSFFKSHRWPRTLTRAYSYSKKLIRLCKKVWAKYDVLPGSSAAQECRPFSRTCGDSSKIFRLSNDHSYLHQKINESTGPSIYINYIGLLAAVMYWVQFR